MADTDIHTAYKKDGQVLFTQGNGSGELLISMGLKAAPYLVEATHDTNTGRPPDKRGPKLELLLGWDEGPYHRTDILMEMYWRHPDARHEIERLMMERCKKGEYSYSFFFDIIYNYPMTGAIGPNEGLTKFVLAVLDSRGAFQRYLEDIIFLERFAPRDEVTRNRLYIRILFQVIEQHGPPDLKEQILSLRQKFEKQKEPIAELVINSQPQGAAVEIEPRPPDGSANLRTPVRVKALKHTRYRVRFSLDGHRPAQAQVTTGVGGPYAAEVLLEDVRDPPVYTDWPFDEAEAKRRQKEASEFTGLPIDLQVHLPRGVKLLMVLIPQGEFIMGYPPGPVPYPRHGPLTGWAHRVRISKPFYIGKYEMTQAQWHAVTGHNPSRFTSDHVRYVQTYIWDESIQLSQCITEYPKLTDAERYVVLGKNPGDFRGDPDRPVENASWEDCQKMIETLNKMELTQSLRDKLQGEWSFALPAEAKWEYACAAGTSEPYYFGRHFSTDLANYNGLSDKMDRGRPGIYRAATVRIGSFLPNAWGLHDTYGNVAEWCQDVGLGDCYTLYKRIDPVVLEGGQERIIRGGDWYGSAQHCLSAYRFAHKPDMRGDLIGLRLALVAKRLR